MKLLRHSYRSVVPLLAVIASLLGVQADEGSFETTVQPFLAQHCQRCHGAYEQKGERRFDEIDGTILDDNQLVDLQDILDQLNLGEMPPSDESQPSDDDRRRVVAWLTKTITEYHRLRAPESADAVLRRLNAREYRNTVRDLLKLEMVMFDPTQGFPQDQQTEHLDNIGESLVTSGYLLQQYLDAADAVISKAMTPLIRPNVQTWVFDKNFAQQPEIDQVHRKTNKFAWMTLYEVRGADKHEGAYGAIRDFVSGVPMDGVYEIRLEAEALNRVHQYDDGFLGTDKNEPLRLGIVPGDVTVGELHHTQPIEPLLAEIELADERRWYTTRIWLDAGKTPRFTFENGSMDVRNLWTRVLRQYPELFPKPKSRGIVESRYLAIKHGDFPQIRLHKFEIRGPIYEDWPTESHAAILGDHWEQAVGGDLADEALHQHLNRFLARVYRRPVADDEVARIEQVIQTRQAAGRSQLEAFGDGLKAALCSPGFLYLDESTTDGEYLSSWAMASRLSYFLWSSMPDERLFAAAEAGRILEADALLAEMDRMLSDPRSEAFVEGFLGSWLTLRDLGATPPDRSTFRSYYHYDLESAMREETKLFTRRLIDENLSVRNFLDSEFTFVNKPLAKHYGIEPPTQQGFHLVKLDDRRRGGLLGQASVLTVTANGIDTSPVVRGVWLLENIMGTPPSPPPPDVEPLDPDIRGAKTIREQLQKHRDVSSCNDCHRKIDPMGFALENFDPVGRWRDSYGKQGPIDASGELPGGQQFTGIQEFKALLLKREEVFCRALTEKLLSYATGRMLTAADRPEVDRIVHELKLRGNGFRDLLRLLVTSEVFRTK